MNKFLETIYNRSPITFQNLFCSLYGIHLYRERYGWPWKNYLDGLMRTQFASQEEIASIQINSLKNLLLHAIKYVPYYKNVINLKEAEVETITSMDIMLDMIRDIPVLDKSLLREVPESFLSKLYNVHDLVKINTSGTTGTPLTIYVSPNARKMNYAFFARSKRWAGVKDFDRSITFAGRTIVPVHQKKPPFWRKNLIFNNTLFSSYHLSESTLGSYVDKIKEIEPIFIDSYPSCLVVISDFLIRNKIDDIKTQAIITSAETLLEIDREKIEMAFGCKVYDQYGSAEQVVFVCQCEEGSYHINPEYGYVEILDNNNRPVKNGELGEIVCTGFTNDAMPLIRYKIGDMGIMSDEKCKCGRNFPVMQKIYGRSDDILITPEGKYVGRLDPVFKGVQHSVKEAQIVQEELDLITIRVVKAENYQKKDGDFIISELRKRMGESITYQIQFVNSIPRTQSGKFRAVICKVKK